MSSFLPCKAYYDHRPQGEPLDPPEVVLLILRDEYTPVRQKRAPITIFSFPVLCHNIGFSIRGYCQHVARSGLTRRTRRTKEKAAPRVIVPLKEELCCFLKEFLLHCWW